MNNNTNNDNNNMNMNNDIDNDIDNCKENYKKIIKNLENFTGKLDKTFDSEMCKNIDYKEKYEQIIRNLEDFAEKLDEIIDSKMSSRSFSMEDIIRKNAYCLALEKDKNTIYNIIEGKKFYEYDY